MVKFLCLPEGFFELEIIDNDYLEWRRGLEKGSKLSIPYYNYQYELNEESSCFGIVLRNNSWRVERVFGKKG